jgi:hypothetical protein
MCNLCYGANYPILWLENHLKSICDPSNLPALKSDYDLEYVLFTDDATLHELSRHPNFMKLAQICEINIVKLTWPADSDTFGSRYQVLAQMLQETLKVALKKEAYAMSAWVADLVFAKGSLPKIISHIEKGHDAVYNVPIRSAADAVHPLLAKLPGAPSDLELFEMAYANLHHLWIASDWQTRRFSKFPYSIVWDSGTGLVAHNFSVTPIVFRPNSEMLNVQGGIDTDLPSYIKNPYWATDWMDAAVAGVEPLSNGHYPPFTKSRASVENVVNWAKHGGLNGGPAVHPCQPLNLPHPLYYPSKAIFNNDLLALDAAVVASQIKHEVMK